MAADHKQVFMGRHVVNRLLTGPGSEKVTRHHQIRIETPGTHYLPGDALGLHPVNDEALVERIIEVIGATGDEVIQGPHGATMTFREALTIQNINVSSRRLIEFYAKRGVAQYASLLDQDHAGELKQYIAGRNEAHDVLDVLETHRDIPITPFELSSVLRRNLPRLYSVASSQKMFPDQVHVLIVSVRYTIRGREHLGPCSTWMADRFPIGGAAEMYLQNQQRHFSLPADPTTPMIMVGPGTGIAPFRAFLQDRRVSGATGRNWLFFGEQRRATDFLYEDELTSYEQDGFLRLDLAFSRDQPQKVYVQHRMREQARDLWAWLEAGAEFLVCGDKNRMAADVEQELLQIIQTQGGRSEDQAREYLDAMKTDRRYKRDVY